jgi:hypothetical protein
MVGMTGSVWRAQIWLSPDSAVLLGLVAVSAPMEKGNADMMRKAMKMSRVMLPLSHGEFIWGFRKGKKRIEGGESALRILLWKTNGDVAR